MGVKAYPLASTSASKTVPNTAVKNEYSPGSIGSTENTVSTLGEYRGGSLIGWPLTALEKCSITFYDTGKEETEEEINKQKVSVYNFGPIYFKEKETRTTILPFPLVFSKALYCHIAEGKLEGVVFCDIE